MKTAIHWFRRDLRITDNTALAAAAARAENVVPVYIVSDWCGEHRWTGAMRQQFLCGSLASLDRNLREIGGRLIVRQGEAVGELWRLVAETKAEAIFFNRDPDPFGRAQEVKLFRLGEKLRIEIYDFKDISLHERDEVLTGSEGAFRVFTPYAKAWGKLPKDAPRGRLKKLHIPGAIPSLALPTLETWGLKPEGTILEAGERAARERMKVFLSKALADYGARRDFPAEDGTSRLSQDLRFGLLSIRELHAKCHETAEKLPARKRANGEKFIGELIWREFCLQVMWHHPEVLEVEFSEPFRGMKWPDIKGGFERWRDGETGFPIIDAAMRQMRETGFMPNRARMIVAMFLTKDLHVDWRQGERYFMQKLVDGEIANNNAGWQWCAGTGADAAPYFRIQNPWTQTARYDPVGEYIKRWLPELRDVAARDLARPPESGSLVPGYPAPMVDHTEERVKTLEFFKSYRKQDDERQ